MDNRDPNRYCDTHGTNGAVQTGWTGWPRDTWLCPYCGEKLKIVPAGCFLVRGERDVMDFDQGEESTDE